jgi:hypothetical protein
MLIRQHMEGTPILLLDTIPIVITPTLPLPIRTPILFTLVVQEAQQEQERQQLLVETENAEVLVEGEEFLL